MLYLWRFLLDPRIHKLLVKIAFSINFEAKRLVWDTHNILQDILLLCFWPPPDPSPGFDTDATFLTDIWFLLSIFILEKKLLFLLNKYMCKTIFKFHIQKYVQMEVEQNITYSI